jgi:flagellar biogenesis protein FliO
MRKPERITAMFRNFAIIIMMILASLGTSAGVKVKSIDLKTNGANGYINVALEGRSSELPDMKVFGKTIELILSDAEAFTGITKNMKGALLSANVLNGKVIIKVTLPYEIRAERVNLGWNNKNIEIIFPRAINITRTETDRPVDPEKILFKTENKILAKVENLRPKENLNEDYLKKLMEEENKKITSPDNVAFKKDEVKLKQSAVDKSYPVNVVTADNKKEDKGGFSFAGYALKFTIFLALVLGLFYGIVQLLKRGVFNRGKLGFLNNNQMIQVLSTTYVGPKRSLLVIKAHKQIFLVANSENGIQFLSEMSDTTGLMKEGEKLVTGTNFDLNLNTAEITTSETSFNIKEDIHLSHPLPEEKGIQGLSAKDIVKFSDELKKKAKKLRPIEFNKNEANV